MQLLTELQLSADARVDLGMGSVGSRRYFLYWPRDPTLLAIPHLVPKSGVLLSELCVAGCNTVLQSKRVDFFITLHAHLF